MDIAKIRKKIKELEEKDGQADADTGPANPQGDTGSQPEEQIPEPSAEPQVPDEEAAPEEHHASGKGDAGLAREPEAAAPPTHGAVEGKKTGPGVPEKKQETEEEKILEILTFGLMKEEFAFNVSDLEEILRHQRITKVPRVPKYVLGITSLRGKIIPVIDLKLKLSLTDTPSYSNEKEKILIIKGPKGPIGAAVDKVIGVVRIAQSAVQPPPSHLSEAELKYVDGVAVVDKRFVSIINIDETVSLQTQWA